MQGSPMCGTPMQITSANSKPTSSPRSRRKPKWKLKFHHQALPQEYLNHYETWQHTQPQPPSPAPITSITQTLGPALDPLPELDLATPSPPITPQSRGSTSPPMLKSPPPKPSPLLSPTSVRLTDLPYMGEMILDNARPRRGRKPKKLDICHLIYKNYGTTVVDEPLNLCMRDFAIPTMNRLQPTPSLLSHNTMNSTIFQHNQHSSNDNQVSMCKFKFTSGSKPSLLEKKLLTTPHHPGMNQRQQNHNTQRRPKSLDILTQQQLLNKLLVNEAQNKSLVPNLATTEQLSRTLATTDQLSRTLTTSEQLSRTFSNFQEKVATVRKRNSDSLLSNNRNSDVVMRSNRNSDPVMSSLLRSSSSDVEMKDEDEESDEDVPDTPDSFSNAGNLLGYTFNHAFPAGESASETSFPASDQSYPSNEQNYPLGNEAEPLFSDSVRYCDNSCPSMSSTPPTTLHRRKSRKSQAREKLEKTFKERGFLIQTQQLESAEGATYCKFRQLRKFTRYLFRSWKTHLPGEVVNETFNMQ
uniref:Uncharacterized protein n=1 Tax=Cacopsylla melanoneura TaxID=428564 RepID=A0A8D8S7A3_9HEMI